MNDPDPAIAVVLTAYAAVGPRIEEIVVCTADGYEQLNNTPRELVVVG